MRAIQDILDYYSVDALLSLAFFSSVGCLVVGGLADWVMRERGFGIIGNAILIFMGVCVGMAMFHDYLGPMRPSDLQRVIAIGTGAATIVLLMCGVLKRMVMGHAGS